MPKAPPNAGLAPTHQAVHAASDARRMGLALALTLGTTALEALGAFVANSLSLAADAGHLGLDALALALAWAAIHLAQKPPSRRWPWGQGRLEALCGLVNAVLLALVAARIVELALVAPPPVRLQALGPMAAVAAAGLVINLVCLRLLHGHAHSLGTQSAFVHVLGDAANSLGVLCAAALMAWTQNPAWDRRVSFLLAIPIALAAYRLAQKSVSVLLMGAPDPKRDAELATRLLQAPNVVALRALRVWSVHRAQMAVCAHAVLAPDADARGAYAQLRLLIEQSYPKADITLDVFGDV